MIKSRCPLVAVLKLEATGTLPQDAPCCATCRIFGDSTELVIDRAQEFKVQSCNLASFPFANRKFYMGGWDDKEGPVE